MSVMGLTLIVNSVASVIVIGTQLITQIQCANVGSMALCTL